ncbi:protein MMS22-like [Uloborus diversus]|uniref:protein MMS22-like n=1 Tax=Uloborus diversus TaxID=327109 RepID=UPI002408F476|nr:protein MMS22-like [Uloborus diversus]
MFCQSHSFNQLTALVLYDLSYTSVSRFKTVNTRYSSPFICNCIRDFWIMIIYLLDNNPIETEESSFWDSYSKILQIVVKGNSQLCEISIDNLLLTGHSLDSNVSTEASFWLISHIASLYKYDVFGALDEQKIARSGYSIAKYIIHILLSGSLSDSENILRGVLCHVLQLVTLWEPKGDVLLPFTDFFIKKVESAFFLPGAEMKSLSYLYRNAFTWFDYINQLASNPKADNKKTSFDIFLQILILQLKLDSPRGNLWRSLKGRIYSKIVLKKMKELTEIGLQNMFSILLSISISEQFEVLTKICELAAMIETTADHRKQTIAWKAMFVLIHICQQKGHDMKNVVSQSSKFFNSLCSYFALIKQDSMLKTNVMNLLLVYIDGMCEIFERSESLRLFEYQLVSNGFSELLPSCGASELNYILSIFVSILSKIKDLSKKANFTDVNTQCIGLVQLVFENVYPFLLKFSASNTASSIVSDIAYALTSLTCQFSTFFSDSVPTFSKIFSVFVTEKGTNCAVMCRYLCFVLDDSDLMSEICLKMHNAKLLVFYSWLKCALYLPPACSDMLNFTSKALLQSELLVHFPEIKNLNFKSDNHEILTLNFFHLIEDSFNKCKNFQEKCQMRQVMHQYFKYYTDYAVSKIKASPDSSTLNYVYKITAQIVESCSVLLHKKFSADSILPQLLDQMAFPHLVFPKDKTAQSVMLCSIKEYVPCFLKGLFKLDYRNDKCIEREIKDIIMLYIGTYKASSNPLVKLLIDSTLHKPNGLTTDALNFTLDLLKCNIVANSNTVNTNSFEFCFEVFKLCPALYKKDVADVLIKSIFDMYMKSNDAQGEFFRNLLGRILSYFQESIETTMGKTILIPLLEYFVTDKLQLSYIKGFHLFDYFIENVPHVMSELIPFLLKSSEMLENSRGSGEDLLLRNNLRNLIAKLQKKLILKG